MTGMHADAGPTIGDLRATVRMLQRRLNLVEHLCDEADSAHLALVPVGLLRAILDSSQ